VTAPVAVEQELQEQQQVKHSLAQACEYSLAMIKQT
jgi:hypothetical protein